MSRWVRVVGDGVIYTGPCLLLAILHYPSGSQKYVDIYDGLDTIAGKKFHRVRSEGKSSCEIFFGNGVTFDRGIYVDGEDPSEETTIIFEPLPE